MNIAVPLPERLQKGTSTPSLSAYTDPVLAEIVHGIAPFIAIRQDLHQHPELAFAEHRTSELATDHLRSWGYQVNTGYAGTGFVASLKRGKGARTIGIRADMDALPIIEETGLAYASRHEGRMHACGHDGHTTIALTAAKYLAEQGDFDGTVHFVFQPAEEIGQGAKRMIEDGLFRDFQMDGIYALHNWPGLAQGKFAFVEGPAMASVDFIRLKMTGKGGHGAEPQHGIDPIVAAAHFITALQSIVSRNVAPREMAVATVGSVHAGEAANVIPDAVELQLSLRSYDAHTRVVMKERLQQLASAQAESFGARAELEFAAGFAAVINHQDETRFAREAALSAFGPEAIDPTFTGRTASEDFAFMLQEKPGSYLFIGNGGSANLHNPGYNFNDALLAPAARYWVALVQSYLNGARA